MADPKIIGERGSVHTVVVMAENDTCGQCDYPLMRVLYVRAEDEAGIFQALGCQSGVNPDHAIIIKGQHAYS